MKDELDQAVGRFPRHAPEVSRSKAEAVLFDELDKTALLFDQGGKLQRDAMMAALEAVEGFLGIRGFSGQHIQPLEMLRKELDFIYKGNRSLILQPGVENRADLPIRHKGPGEEQIKICAAACSEAIYQLGKNDGVPAFDKLTRTQAHAKIARAMEKWPTYNQTLKIAGRTIKGWRDKFEAKARREAKRSGYQVLIDQFLKDEKGYRYLKEVIKTGPPMTGGFRK
jgi:hypothetical protein